MQKIITIRKALQVKKTLSGDIAAGRQKISEYNSQKTETPNVHVDLKVISETLSRNTQQLIELKSAVTVANIGIYKDIITAEELKGQISFYEGLDVVEYYTDYSSLSAERVKLKTILFMNETDVNKKISELKKELEATLDRIDYFNSTTKITVDLD